MHRDIKIILAISLFLYGKGMETIHLLLTDVVMPHMGGKGLLEKVKTRLPNIKVLFISGHTDTVINHHGLFEPYAALLQKRFSANLLARKVRELLAQSICAVQAPFGSWRRLNNWGGA